jgi:hypothetical protein
MGTREQLVSCLVLVMALAQSVFPASSRAAAADTWLSAPASGEESAKAWIAATGQADRALTITFPTVRRCYVAELMLTDDAGQVIPSEPLTVTADGEQFAVSASPSGVVGVYEAPPPLFHAIKRARALRLATSEAAYSFSTAGSAAAINSAWKACQESLRDEPVADTNTQDSAAPALVADHQIPGDSMEDEGDNAIAEPAVGGATPGPVGFAIILLLFAVANAYLFLQLTAKLVSSPPLSPSASGQWRRGAALVGAVGWIVLPLMGLAAYGLAGAALALVGYFVTGLMLAAIIKPGVARSGLRYLLEPGRDLRLRLMGVRRGSRLIVEGFRRHARRQGTAPTEKTTDAEILALFERVGSAFKTVASQRRESLRGARLNYIVWQFLQAHEALSHEAFEAHLQQELSTYRTHGLPAVYRRELEL